MKRQYFAAGLLIMSSFASYAASDPQQTSPNSEKVTATTSAPKATRPHSHMEERTGIAAPTPKKSAPPPKSNHNHQRDMK